MYQNRAKNDVSKSLVSMLVHADERQKLLISKYVANDNKWSLVTRSLVVKT